MLQLRHISKSFGAVRALDDVSLTFGAGEIHGLVGENGAGKSTAIKIVTGLQRPDAGQIFLDGQRISLAGYSDAQAKGIGIVHQELNLIPDASVAENIMLDKLITRRIAGFDLGVIDWPRLFAEARIHMDRIGLELSAEQPVRGLSAAAKQMIQIARAMSADVKVLLLDEPTSSLTEHEAARLFSLMRALRDKGVALIFVSHKLEEVFALCDRVSVLRDGRNVGQALTRDLTPRALVHMMIGRESNDDHLGMLSPDFAQPVLCAKHVSKPGKADDISFCLHRGEVLGFYGLVGSGRTELARLLIGEDSIASGTITLRGKPVTIRNIAEALYTHRLGYVSENRKEEGLLLDDGVQTNITLPIWPRLRRTLTRRIDGGEETVVATKFADAMRIKTPSLAQRVKNLSGGNQQKVSIGKWLAADCDILIIDEPTVGVDVGAKGQIHQLIWDLAARKGKSIIVISSDLPEIVGLANRLLVFRAHRIVGEVRDIDVKRKTYAQVSEELAPWFE